MEVAFNVASWVVEKALGPVTDTVLETWAASRDLGPNVDALTKELKLVRAVLKPMTHRMEIDDNPDLEALLQELRNQAYRAEDVLDELDYFRIQDELEGTFEAADEHASGYAGNLLLNARHTAKAVGKMLCLPACSSAESSRRRARDTVNQANGSGIGNTIRTIGKRFPCSSLPPVLDDDDAHHSGMLIPRDETPKLEFGRVDASEKMRDIAQQLRFMRTEVSEIIKTLGPSLRTTPQIDQKRTTISESTEPKLYGRDLIMNSIIHDITKGEYCNKDDLTVLSIFGQGGIGKTTLTQFIYQNRDVQKHFQVMVWECVSQNFQVDKLLEKIVKFIPPVEDEKLGTSGELIGQRLKSKRFLLVLDDIWKFNDEDEWKRLLLPFKKSQAKGNIIIVTTRFQALAKIVTTTTTNNRIVNLEGMEHEEFEKLFLVYVFGDEEYPRKYHILRETGGKILDKLKGSPLAAKTVGRVLRKHLELDHWTRVLESKKWESEKDDTDIMPALKLSYDYLPFHLQQCFFYCALFPEDYAFDEKELIYFWIGLEILQSVHSKDFDSIEKIGLSNLDDLVNYGFFKKEEKKGHSYYLIHDLLHDLALKIASSMCLVIDGTNVTTSLEIPPSIRHLCIHVDYGDDSDGISYETFISELRTLVTQLKIEQLQTLMVFGDSDENLTNLLGDLIQKASGLRVVHLSKMHSRMEFSTLSHLRYLSLGSIDSSEIHLPSMLSRFYHLRILNLQKWRGSRNLPRYMSNLTKLAHFLTNDDEDYSKICNVGKLQFLQELKRLRVNKESNGFELKQLKKLIEIRELGIYNLEKIHTQEEAIEANLIHKKYLQKLTLDWDTTEVPKNERDAEGLVLEKLEPRRCLQELCINGHGSHSCPAWLGSKLSIKGLQSLQLAGVEWEVLPSLGRMGALRELILKHISTLKEFGPRHFGVITEQSFCSLKRLELIALKGLEKWVMGERYHLLSHLEVLIIKDCPDLLELPFAGSSYHLPRQQDHEGKIHWFPNLQELGIENCPKLMSLPPIPWTETLCSIQIGGVGLGVVHTLNYRRSSSHVGLTIRGNFSRSDDCLQTLDEKALVFNNLRDLKVLVLINCPPIESKHLQMLTSLKGISVSGHLFAQSGDEGEVEWHLPVERMWITSTPGKELSQLLFHLPKLSDLGIRSLKGTEACVAVEKLQPTAHMTCRHPQQKAEELIIFPPHLSNCLRKLEFHNCQGLRLLSPKDCVAGGRGEGGGGLLALRSLQDLVVRDCPEFLSAYNKTSVSSTGFPFPSSLKSIHLRGEVGMRTLEPLANLTSLTKLELVVCGNNFRSDGLRPLLTQGQLSELVVLGIPSFFVGSDPIQGLKDEDQVRLLHHISKIQEITTDGTTGFLTAPICTIFSSSLTKLKLKGSGFGYDLTKEQEEAFQLLTSLQDLTMDA